jgi:hypothetical protein
MLNVVDLPAFCCPAKPTSILALVDLDGVVILYGIQDSRKSVAFNFNQLRFRVSQGDFIVGNTAFDRITEGCTSNDVNFCRWNKPKIEESLSDGAFAVVAVYFCTTSGCDIDKHASTLSAVFPFSMVCHCHLRVSK